MKITLLSPKGPLYRHRGGIFIQSLRYAPLTLTTLAALVPPELKAQINIMDEGVQDIAPELESDLIGITAITGNAPRAYEWAEHFRRRNIPVVMGGPHITLMPDEAQQHADAVVVGYAEESWPQLLRDFAQGQMHPRYVQSPQLSLAGMPIARRELLKGHRYATLHTFEATRGCVHSCEFCTVPTAWGTKPYLKPVEEVAADIRQMKSRHVLFLDLNLIADPHHAANLFEALIPLKITWFGLSTIMLADNPDLLKLAARSGCTGLLIGFESLSRKNMYSAHKGFGHPDHYKEAIARFHQHGIALMGCFVFGLDEDTPDVFMQTARFAIETQIELPRYAIVTPFPNTPLYHRLKAEGRILTNDWSLYDAQHVVFQPAQMTPQELYQGTEAAWKHTYGWRSMWQRLRGVSRQPLIAWATNLGYRFYAYNLHRFYTCDAPL